MKKTLYYKDPLNDDFAGTNITPIEIGEDYNYIPKNIFFRIGSAISRAIAMPIIAFIEHVVYGIKFKNRKALKGIKGAYLYGNHSGIYDVFTPMLLAWPHNNKILASADAVSIKGMKNWVKMLGALPVPNKPSGLKNFVKAVEYCHKKGIFISVYPEAHIWPYYTGVRPFPATSFRYPVKDGSPCVAFFTAYSQPKGLARLFRKVSITVYVSDPIYPNKNLPQKAAQQELRNKVFDFMKQCSERYSTFEHIRYVQLTEESQECDGAEVQENTSNTGVAQ